MNGKYNMQGWRRWGRSVAGFTLIELMIVLVIIAILAALAYPSYTKYIMRTHRTAAESCLSEVANFMERYYTTNLKYAGAVVPAMNCKKQTDENYTYALANASSTKYSVTATPINAQLSRDTKCGTLKLDQAGTRTVSGGGPVADCW